MLRIIQILVVVMLSAGVISGTMADVPEGQSTSAACSCSRQADSLYLISTFFPATSGPSWTVDVPGGEVPWNTGASLDQWVGVVLNTQGCVQEINLEMRNLSGAIPSDIGQLCGLEKLILSNNALGGGIPASIGDLSLLEQLWLINADLTGPIPVAIGNLDNLFDLRLSDNQLSGNIPPELGNCDGLFRLWLDDNLLTGEIPDGLGDLPFLSIFFVDGNQLSGCVPESFAGLSTLNQFEFFGNAIECLPDLSGTGLSCNRLRGQNNRLTFDDILPNVDDFCTDIFYSPQDSIGESLLVSVPAGSNYAIDLGIDQDVPDNQYRWFRNGLLYPPILNANQLVFTDIGFADAATYRAEVTNPGAPALTLYSRPVTINVFCATETVQLDTFICPGEVIQINGDSYGAGFPMTGSYFFPDGNRHGCDSVLNVQVFFHDEAILEIHQGICPGDTIIVNGVPYHQGQPTGLEIIPGGATTGCDSFVSVNLNILPVIRDTFSTEICEGDSLVFGMTNLFQSGVYADTFQASNGCDSISVVDLTVYPVVVSSLSPEICQGDTFHLAGQSYTAPGEYSDTLIASTGCDSIFSVTLTVHPVFEVHQNDTICEPDSFLFQGNWYQQSGVYSDTLTTVNGCDSVLTLDLLVLPQQVTTVDTIICSGAPLIIADSLINQSGTYQEILQADNGCDSIVIWTVSILQTYFQSRDTAICSGDLLVLGGDTILESGNYPLLYEASNGCDSLVEWLVDIYDTAFTEIQADICEGFAYLFGNEELTSSGIYFDTLQTAQGCDSFIRLQLAVLPVLETDLSADLCAGDSLLFGGQWISDPGIYRDSLQAQNGCDSLVTLSVSLNASPTVHLFDTICAGDSLLFAGALIGDPGTVADTSLTIQGCDSITILTLEVLPVATTHLQETLCDGESVVFGSHVLDTAGLYIDTLVAANGCDSIVILDLDVLPVFFTPLQASICSGDTLVFGTRPLSEQGVYLDTLTAANGCDSILQLELSLLPVYQTPLDASICEGDSILFAGIYLTEPGQYLDTLTSANGCDSVLQLLLEVLPVAYTNLDTAICEGESVVFGGNVLSAAGEYVDTLTAANGCDSIVLLDLSVKSVPFVELSVDICEGDQYIFGNSTLSLAGIYQEAFTGSNGCDSIVELTLNVLGPDQLGQADAGKDGTACGSETSLSALPPMSGITGKWVLLSGTGTVNPDSEPSAVVADLGLGINEFVWIVSSDLCPEYDADTVTIMREAVPDATDDQAFLPYTADSVVVEVLENDIFTNVTEFDLFEGSPPSLGLTSLLLDGTFEYRGPSVDAIDNFSYFLCNAICPDLCDTGFVTIVLEEPPLPKDPDIPNAFSPNGDGINDLWVIGDLDRLSVVYPENELVIFNRWGDVVYEAAPYRNNWDGRDQSSGKVLAEGTYWYLFRLSASDRKIYKGDITILR